MAFVLLLLLGILCFGLSVLRIRACTCGGDTVSPIKPIKIVVFLIQAQLLILQKSFVARALCLNSGNMLNVFCWSINFL